MLVLARHVDEAVMIDGGRIKLVVVDIRGDVVKLGFDADKSIVIDRGEVHEARERSKQEQGGGEQ